MAEPRFRIRIIDPDYNPPCWVVMANDPCVRISHDAADAYTATRSTIDVTRRWVLENGEFRPDHVIIEEVA